MKLFIVFSDILSVELYDFHDADGIANFTFNII